MNPATPPNHALQRTAASCHCCNRRVSWPHEQCDHRDERRAGRVVEDSAARRFCRRHHFRRDRADVLQCRELRRGRMVKKAARHLARRAT
jgi:hypothetical protein